MGRSCPLAYRTSPDGLKTAPVLETKTAYFIGGLYGNELALARILEMALEERQKGLPEPSLVFNGDFHWLNAESAAMQRITDAILAHHPTAGNVELELARPSEDAGCGCAYPAWVDDAMVERSNQIMHRLQSVAACTPGLSDQLQRLPLQRRVQVGDCRIGVVHGDPESVAGWGLALEQMPSSGSITPRLQAWFQCAQVDVLAGSHTCVAYLQDFFVDNQRRLVMNNGAAGMPNFQQDPRGLISRISLHPSPFEPMYGTRLGGVYCDAVSVEWPVAECLEWLARLWPAGSPADRSYRSRFQQGPAHYPSQADRITETVGPL